MQDRWEMTIRHLTKNSDFFITLFFFVMSYDGGGFSHVGQNLALKSTINAFWIHFLQVHSVEKLASTYLLQLYGP